MRNLSLIGRIDLALVKLIMFAFLIIVEHDFAALLFKGHMWILPSTMYTSDTFFRWLYGCYMVVLGQPIYRTAMDFLYTIGRVENRLLDKLSQYKIVRKSRI